ncbi:hypothetical protein HL653_21515 [Sphingomonas sp. AP4-R1]|uniref:hypothetical protein n=1 Tax=Sphingomonas sp. AP4-R1 TaxID=2735134 RepID=UPI0014935CA4|nr:hypothetical protein [Sphingomonas sp. AP4-R1]QJU56374.1 hypothetical protein HL653_21515 [Sphingomonas sp. AP4-R1]
MDAGFVRESLLAPALFLAKPPQIFRKALPDIHGRLKTRLSSIDLQTISDIRVDFASTQSVGATVTDSMRRYGEGGEWERGAMTLVLIDETAPTQLLRRVPQGEARLEKTLRDLLYDNPDAVPVHEFDPGYGRLVAVAKELNIPGVGFIDVLLMDERGKLIVVECKLWRNPQARREVVGQILDYARELARYSYEDLQRQVSIATKRQGNVLYALATSVGGTLDEGAFVDRVSRDLASGRFLLLVVGDGITEGTRRIGEYLRDQPGLAFDFGLIEIAEYRVPDGAGGEHVMLQPRVLAQTAIIERHVIRSG